MKEQLKPCPFCGSEPLVNHIEPHRHGFSGMPDHPGSCVIECGCGAGLIDDNEGLVTNRWNTRAEPPINNDKTKRPSRVHVRMLADKIIADYKEHYDFPCQGESHMYDCITDDLEKFELAEPFNDEFCTDKKVRSLLDKDAELVGAVLRQDDQHAIIINGDVNWYPADAKYLSERAIGRAEVLAMVLREDCEEPFASMVTSHALADTGDYSYHWDEEKMREYFRVDETAWSLLCNIEAENIALDFKYSDAAKDQARYQYLRSRDLDAIDKGGLFVGMVPDNIVINLADLDELVDAAMEVKTEPKETL